MGMQLYGSHFNFKEEAQRANFDNFLMSFLALFQVQYARSKATHLEQRCVSGADSEWLGAGSL